MMAVEGEMRSCRGRAARLCVWTGILTWSIFLGCWAREQCGAFPCRPLPPLTEPKSFSSRAPSLGDYRHSLDWTRHA